MSTRDTVRETPESRGAGSADPAAASAGKAGSASDAPVTVEKRFDPYKFQSNTMPLGLRAELIAAELPSTDPQRMQDTVPPNGAVQADEASERPGVDPSFTQARDVQPDEPATAGESHASRSLLPWIVGGSTALIAALIVVALSVSRAPGAGPRTKVADERPVAPKVAPTTRDDPAGAGAVVASAPLPASRPTRRNPSPSSMRATTSARPPSNRVDSTPVSSVQATEAKGSSSPAAGPRTNPFDKPFKPPAD